MAYLDTTWQNGTTPINETNLNNIESGIKNLDKNLGTNTQAVYDNTQTYAVGSIVIYNNLLYKCTTAVETAEDFDSTKWTQTNILDVIKNANDSINTSALNINGTEILTDTKINENIEIGNTGVNLKNAIKISGTEEQIGIWYDDKPLYRQIINIGNLPNATLKSVAYNIPNSIIRRIYGIAYSGNAFPNNFEIPLPYVGVTSTYNISLDAYQGNIRVTTSVDRTGLTAIVFLEYTKTTD